MVIQRNEEDSIFDLTKDSKDDEFNVNKSAHTMQHGELRWVPVN